MSSKKSGSKSEKLVKEIKQLRKNIRKKHQTLAHNIIDDERFMEKTLKPVITPLQKLVQSSSKKEEPTTGVEMDDLQLKSKRPLEEDEPEHEVHKRTLLDPELPLAAAAPSYEETVYETPPTVEQLVRTPEGRKSAEFYISTYFKGPVAKKYMRKFFYDSNHSIDNVFGPYYGPDNILMLGKYPMKISEDDDIIIDEIIYKGSPGLYELIFMKRPSEDIYSDEDLESYAQLIAQTEAYLHPATSKVKSSTSYKYKNIIKPIIAKILPTSIPRTSRLRSGIEGRGLMNLHSSRPEYVYWNNVNELCERLKLLIMSRNAGHTGHENEILSIIEELQEAGVIKENASIVEGLLSE